MNMVKRGKTILIKFTSIFILLGSLFTFLKPAAAEPDGFLGIDLVFHWHGGSSMIDENRVPNDVFGIQLSLIGAADHYNIVTQIQLVTNLVDASEQYRGRSDYLALGEVDYLSYASINIQYSVWRNDHLNLLAGYGLGHLGYLSQNFSQNPFTIFLSPIGSIWWFISSRFATFIEAELPMGTYRRNASRLWHFRFKNEVVFEPKGTVTNPRATSVFLALGWQFDYIDIITRDLGQNAEAFLVRPYLRFTYLY